MKALKKLILAKAIVINNKLAKSKTSNYSR